VAGIILRTSNSVRTAPVPAKKAMNHEFLALLISIK